MITQITKADHERRVVRWYANAVNDPTVRPSLGEFVDIPTGAASDWSEAYFMDDTDTGLLAVDVDRRRRAASIALWALGRNSEVAAALMRFAAWRLPRLYSIDRLTFSISAHNEPWVSSISARLERYIWGREPSAMYVYETQRWGDALRFSVPVSALLRKDRL